jgi:5-methylthioadenosine/S-adenosylhomocysteine deaminase
MKIKPVVSVISPDCVKAEVELTLDIRGDIQHSDKLTARDAYAYAPFINAHDHLVGNWFPRSGDKRPYPNSHIWVEDMRHSFAYEERNNYWINDGSFNLTEPNAYSLCQLGAYKNLFSGCVYVQDHSPNQPDAYYDGFPITVIRKFRQCHSITLGNWWGGGSCEEEMAASKNKQPFIIHLAEGTDEISGTEFAKLKKRGILQPNLLIIHGIALTKPELQEIARVGASVCWCPSSNFYLIGETLDIKSCLEYGVNVVLGTDSTQTGGINILDEYANAHARFPDIPLQTLYAMMSVNSAKALFLSAKKAVLNPKGASDLLLIDAVECDPFENLLEINSEHIQLLLHNGIPLYGDAQWLECLKTVPADYTEFRVGKREKFVIGDPMELNDRIDAVLGYHKDFPFLPF